MPWSTMYYFGEYERALLAGRIRTDLREGCLTECPSEAVARGWEPSFSSRGVRTGQSAQKTGRTRWQEGRAGRSSRK